MWPWRRCFSRGGLYCFTRLETRQLIFTKHTVEGLLTALESMTIIGRHSTEAVAENPATDSQAGGQGQRDRERQRQGEGNREVENTLGMDDLGYPAPCDNGHGLCSSEAIN